MGVYPDFSQYNDDLDIDALAEQGVDALKEELDDKGVLIENAQIQFLKILWMDFLLQMVRAM